MGFLGFLGLIDPETQTVLVLFVSVVILSALFNQKVCDRLIKLIEAWRRKL